MWRLRGGSALFREALASALVLSALAGAPALLAHDVTPAAVLELLNGPEGREKAGVVSASRDAGLPRLLVVEVGEGWWALPRARRAELAKEWRTLWRHGVRQGVVSVLDVGSREPVVSYRPDGEAVAAEAPPPPSRETRR